MFVGLLFVLVTVLCPAFSAVDTEYDFVLMACESCGVGLLVHRPIQSILEGQL